MIKPTKPGRANRIADQIQRDVAELIQKEVSNPKTGLVTLTGCEICLLYTSCSDRYLPL